MSNVKADILPGGGETGALIRAHDWAATPLGPVEAWPQSLRAVVGILLSSRYQMWMGWGKDLSFLYNDAYAPTLGVKHPWAVGRPAREVWAEIWPDIGPRIELVLRTGEATWDEGLMLLLQRSGYPEETYHTFSYSPLRDEAGDVSGHLCVVTEETERIIGERRLATLRDLASRLAGAGAEQEMLSATADSLATNLRDLPFTLIYLFDGDAGPARLAARTGILPDHAAAPARIDPNDDSAAWPANKLLANGETVLCQGLDALLPSLPTGAWDQSPHAALVVPIAQPGRDRPAGFLVAGINPYRRLDAGYHGFLDLIAGQVAASLASARAYEAERRRAAALAEIDRAKTAFFANVSHEFRTPLTLMLGPLEDLLTGAWTRTIDPEIRKSLEVSHRNAIRLLRLVNSLLDFARLEAGRAVANYTPTDLPGLTADLAATFRSAVDRAGLTLEVICQTLPEPVLVDRTMWEKIVLNLLSNAFKFTFAGGITVTLRSSPDGRYAELSVRDTGTGITESELPRLFERFHRIEGARGRSFEGSGIGLALVQELVRLHGGTITVDSTFGSGSTFTVAIPLGTAHLPGDRVRAVPDAETTTTISDAFVEEALQWLDEPLNGDDVFRALLVAPPPQGLKGDWRPRILLADDNADMRRYVTRLLAAQYEVEAVGDGETALMAARSRRPDLLLTDVMMPKLDGVGLLRAVRLDPELRDLPVILLTARAGEEARLDGLRAGADDYIAKPFSARELLGRVAANISLVKVRVETAEQLRIALEAGDLGTFSIDAATKAGHISERARAIMGMPPFVGLDTPDERLMLVHPDDRARYLTAYDAAMAGLAPFREEYRIIRPNGDVRWVRTEAIMQRLPDGAARQLTGVVRDITELRIVQEAQRAMQVELERRVAERTRERDRLWRLSRDLLLVITGDGKLVAVNPSWAAVFGWSEADLIGSRIADLMHPDDITPTARRRERLAHGEPVSALENRLRQRDGDYRWFAWTSVAADGLIYSVGRDVTEERAAAEQLATAHRRLMVQIEEREKVEATLHQMQRLEAIGQLTSGVAHDFNNLLTVILGNLEFMRRPPVSPAQSRRLEMMQLAAERGAKLTAQLLAFSRRQRLEPKPVDLNRVIGGMLDLLRSTLGASVTLDTDLPADLSNAMADQTQLELVVLNLVINARDAMPSGGILRIATGTATVGGSRRAEEPTPGDYVTITVADAGTGMTPDVLAKAFEPFFTTKEVGKGSGLGLPQVYGFAKQSGGGVRIDSEPGSGTAVTVFLPYAGEPTERASRIASNTTSTSNVVRLADHGAGTR